MAPPPAFHWLHSVCTCLTVQSGFGRVLYHLTPCCMPVSAAAMLSVSSKDNTGSSPTGVSCGCTHRPCNPPSSHHQCMSCRMESLGFFYQVLLSENLSCSLILSWRWICFLVWVFLSCFNFFIALLFLLLASLLQRFLLSLVSRQLEGRNSCRCCLSPFSAFPTPSFSLMDLSPFYPVSWQCNIIYNP